MNPGQKFQVFVIVLMSTIQTMTSSLKNVCRRSAAEIIRLLQEKQINNYTTAAFCKNQGISHQTFYNWEKKYGFQPSAVNDFIPLITASPESLQPTPFCEVLIAGKTTVRFFGSVDVKYLKTLIC